MKPRSRGSAGGSSSAPSTVSSASTLYGTAAAWQFSRVVQTCGSNPLHSKRSGAAGSIGDVEDRGSGEQGDLDHFAGAPAPARRLAVPDRDQHVAMRDRRAPGHDIGGERRAALAGQFEHRLRLGEQRMEGVARRSGGEILLIIAAREGQHRAEREVPGERDARRDLVGALGERGDEMKLRRVRREQRLMLGRQAARPAP